MRSVLVIAIVVACPASSTFGTWKMNTARSTLTGGAQPKSLTVRIEPHAKGEVFTLDRLERDGRATSSSSILYFDGVTREFQDFDCAGVQSSRRLDGLTVEIRRQCEGSEGIWMFRGPTEQSKELTVDIMEQRRGGPGLVWRLVLEKQ